VFPTGSCSTMANTEFVEASANRMLSVWGSFDANVDVGNLLVYVLPVL
jgi:hypothetical protein